MNILRKVLTLCSVLLWVTLYSHSEIQRYVCDGYGYMEIDFENNKCEVFRTIENCEPINIGSCTIVNKESDCFTIRSIDNAKRELEKITIKELEESASDTVSVTIKMQACDSIGMDIVISNKWTHWQEKKKWKPDGISFSLGIRNKGHNRLIIYPDVDPFSPHTSIGDNKTANYISLDSQSSLIYINNHNIEITIPCISRKSFDKWYILDEYLLIQKDRLLWKNHIFKLQE